MEGWKKLTSVDSQPVWVNMNVATAALREGKGTIIIFEKGNTRTVRESLEDVMRDGPAPRAKVLRSPTDRRAPR